MASSYDWAKWPWQRCPATLEKKWLVYNGRCDLKRKHDGVHVIDRGMEVIEFWVTWEKKLSKFAQLVVNEELRKREAQRE